MGVPMIACDCKVCRSNDERDKRLRSSVKIEVGGHIIVVDSGPDFRQQMLASETKKLDAIIYTHAHKDHTAGLDDVRAFNWINRQAVNLYAEESTLKALKNEYAYAFKSKEEKYPGVPELILNKIGLSPFNLWDEEILPLRVFHHKMPVLGFRLRDFSYVTDASSIPPETLKKLDGTRVLVLNGLRIKEHISHFNLKQALEIIDRINPDKAYITHMSHNIGLHAEVSKQLPSNVFLGFDGLEFEL